MPNDRKTVAIFLPSLVGGGAERVMINIADGLINRGHNIDLVLARNEGSYSGDLPSGIRIVDLQSQRVLTSLPGLMKYLRCEEPQALISTMGHACIVAVWAKFLSRASLRLVLREATTVSRRLRDSTVLRRTLWSYLVRWFYPWADVVVAPSQGVADDLINCCHIPSEQVEVIYNGVNVPDLRARAEEPVRHPWFDLENEPVILAAGRLSKVKDHATLIRAFSLVRNDCPSRLIILGEGEERSGLFSLINELNLAEYIDMPGFEENPYSYMKRSSVFVLSSRNEGMPNVLIEAMAVGTPVVSTDCDSGPREILEGGKYGKLIPVGDVSALAAGILDVIKYQKISLPRDDWYRVFSMDTCIDKYCKFIFAGENT